MKLPPRLLPIKRQSFEEVSEVVVSTETATIGASTADIPTSTPLSTETQTRNRDLEPKGKDIRKTSIGIPVQPVNEITRPCEVQFFFFGEHEV